MRQNMNGYLHLVGSVIRFTPVGLVQVMS